MRILLLSNGTGEDRIAVSLARAWQASRPADSLSALALVGAGTFYQQAGIPLLPVSFSPPSAGFAYLDPRKLIADFQAGLAAHLWRAWQQVRISPADVVIAVGDIVPLSYAYVSGRRFAFMGCALSDYYTGGRVSSYDPLQRWMLRRAALGVFARDPLTCQGLLNHGLPACCCGNPMLDDLRAAPCFQAAPGRAAIALAPGSHADAVANFALILTALTGAHSWDLLCVCAPGVPAAELAELAHQAGWQPQGDHWLSGEATLRFYPASDWGAVLHSADVLLGLAGTANEQAAGLGIPVLALPGQGLQYTARFAEAQSRLLGPALTLVSTSAQVIPALRVLLHEPRFRQAAAQVARERYGLPGASLRIVAEIQSRLN